MTSFNAVLAAAARRRFVYFCCFFFTVVFVATFAAINSAISTPPDFEGVDKSKSDSFSAAVYFILRCINSLLL